MYTLGVPSNCLIPVPAHQVRAVFGTDEAGVLGIVTTDDKIYCSSPVRFTPKPRVLQQCKVRTTPGNEPSYSVRVDFLAIAGSGKASCTCPRRKVDALSTLIVSSLTLSDLIVDGSSANINSKSVSRYGRPGKAKQLLANALAFTLLMLDGTVYTWGDPRYGSLGRHQDEGFDIPCRVEALAEFRVRKIDTGGFLTAALTEDGQLFLWGVTRPGGSQLASSVRNETVALQSILGPSISVVVDVAVGDNHVVALSSDGRLLGLGEGANGELGNACRQPENFAASWSLITGPDDKIVKGIACGRQTTFLVCVDSGDSRYILPDGDAVQVMDRLDGEEVGIADSKIGIREELSVYEDDSELDSADSDLPMEGPEDWFRGVAG